MIVCWRKDKSDNFSSLDASRPTFFLVKADLVDNKYVFRQVVFGDPLEEAITPAPRSSLCGHYHGAFNASHPIFTVPDSVHHLTATAWSTKEHIQLTRIAAERLMDDPSATR